MDIFNKKKIKELQHKVESLERERYALRLCLFSVYDWWNNRSKGFKIRTKKAIFLDIVQVLNHWPEYWEYKNRKYDQ